MKSNTNAINKDSNIEAKQQYDIWLENIKREEEREQLRKENTLLSKATYTIEAFRDALRFLKEELKKADNKEKRKAILIEIRKLKAHFDLAKEKFRNNNLLVEDMKGEKKSASDYDKVASPPLDHSKDSEASSVGISSSLSNN